jgi:RNA recognition motif-containing protein
MTNIFVGNLSFGLTEDAVRFLFEQHGSIERVNIIKDRQGRSKGFGFVEMTSADEAQRAIATLHGKEIQGRPLTVNDARPREQRGFGDGAFRLNNSKRRAARW